MHARCSATQDGTKGEEEHERQEHGLAPEALDEPADEREDRRRRDSVRAARPHEVAPVQALNDRRECR